MHPSEWQARAAAHRARVDPWVSARLDRQSRGERHAVDDFLFDYYPYSPGKLATWHPGYGVVLEGRESSAYLQLSGYRACDDGVTADLAWLASRRARLDLVIRLLSATSKREPQLGCFGMHEWAMVYGQQQEEVRHSSYALRLPPDEIAAAVDGIGLRCTHIDAYRFFTPAAVPLNAHEPTRATQQDWEQPGCLHANMDLYKYAMWFQPFVGSELAADCFELAREARELDMRAAPYDLVGLGYEPIPVETPDGRAEYARQQRALMADAGHLRGRLLAALERASQDDAVPGRS